MKLLLLSGNSLRNKEWIYEVEKQIRDLFDGTYVQDYQHWETGTEWIDLPHELQQLRQNEQEGEYGIFAKSIGTVLTVQAMEQGFIKPKFLLLCGLPLGYITEAYPQFADQLADVKVPVVIIHNDHDTVGSATAVREYLGDAIQKCTFIETIGDHHDYEDYELLREQLQELIIHDQD